MLKTKKIVVSMLLVFALLFTGLGVSSMLPVKATTGGATATIKTKVVEIKDAKMSSNKDVQKTKYLWINFEGNDYGATSTKNLNNATFMPKLKKLDTVNKILVNGQPIATEISGPQDPYLNLWNILPGTLTLNVAHFVFGDEITIKAGCEFPSLAYLDGTGAEDNFVTETDVTFKKTINGWVDTKVIEATPTVDVANSLKLNFSDNARGKAKEDHRFWLEFSGVKMIANGKTAWLADHYTYLQDVLTYNGKTFTEINESVDDSTWKYSYEPRSWGAPNSVWAVPILGQLYGYENSTKILINVHENYLKDHPIQSIGISKDFYFIPGADSGTPGTAFASTKDASVSFVYNEEVGGYGKHSSSYDEIKPATLSVPKSFPTISENKLLTFNIMSNVNCFNFGYNATGGGAKMVARYIKIGNRTVEDIVKNTNDADWVYPNEFPYVHKVNEVEKPWEAFRQPVLIYANGNKMTLKVHENVINQFTDDITVTVLPSIQLLVGRTLYQVQPMAETMFYYQTRNLTINIDGVESVKQYKTTESVTLDTPVKNGFTFTNWFEDADCTIPATIDTMPDHDYKIYAGFKANPYNVVVDGFSISTKGDIALNFYAVLSDDMLDGTMNAYKGETLIYKINIADATVANADHRKFSVPVPAKDMFEEITIKFNSSDGTTRKEAVHSVAEYINAIINDNSGNFEAEKPLLNELLRYGALAKVHFYGGTLPEGMVAPTLDASALNDFKATSVGTLPENVSILGYSLLLESNTSIRVYFTSTLATAPDTAYLVDGVAVVPVQVMDDDVKHQDADGNYVYYIEIKDIAAKDLVKDYVISIGGYQLTVCAVDYAGTVLNNPDSSADLQNLVKSLYLCSQEAVKYFPSNQQNILGFILPAQVDKSHVDLMKGAGLNGIFIGKAGPQVYTFNVEAPTEDNLNTVKLLGDNGIKSYIHVGKGAKYLKNIEKFADNPNIAGFLIDEPDKNDIAEVAKQVDSFNNLGKGKTLYVNLFPSFAPIFVTPEKKQYNSYLEYLEDVYNSILSKLDGERILSVDRYPIRVNKGDKYLDTNWLKDVEIVRNFAKTHNLKTNFFVQTMALGKGGVEDREPTYEDIRVQEYALMAYGYDSISLFCYGTPDKNVVKFGGAGPINTDGTVNTTVYNNVAKADKEMIALEKILDNFAWQGVFTTKGSFNLNHSMNISAINSLTSVKSDHDGIVGYFKGIADGRDGFLAVNFNETTKVKSNNVKLNFDANLHYNKALVIRGGLATSVDISANTLTLNLGAGEGVFAIPYKA